MRTISSTVMLCFSLGLIAACNNNGDIAGEEIKTVEEWQNAEFDVFLAKFRECRNNPGMLRETPNCQNIERAFSKKIGTFQGEQEEQISAAARGLSVEQYRQNERESRERAEAIENSL